MELWVRDVVERCPHGTKFLLAANKIDSPHRVLSHEDIAAFCAKLKIPFVETSAKTGRGVDEAFETLAGIVADGLEPAAAKPGPALTIQRAPKNQCC